MSTKEPTTQEPTPAPYQPSAAQWLSFRLQCWKDDNNIEQYRPARELPDYFMEVFKDMWARLGED